MLRGMSSLRQLRHVHILSTIIIVANGLELRTKRRFWKMLTCVLSLRELTHFLMLSIIIIIIIMLCNCPFILSDWLNQVEIFANGNQRHDISKECHMFQK